MKSKTALLPYLFTLFKYFVAISIASFSLLYSQAQAVTEVITDFNGYWKSGTTANNSVKPNNSHNLLSFTYNNTRYSTGVNDGLLSAKGESFVASDFWSLPVISLTGLISSNTKVGFGALYDGVANGPSVPAPVWGIESYLTDGFKGLGLGTCVANLPVGTLNFSITNIQPSAIGDGVPDVLITQVADPTSNSYDRYSFTDVLGNRIGNYQDVIFNNIAPVGNWTADFYEARSNPLVLTSGFTQTDRPIRLLAFDFSDFGITTANYLQIKTFTINLSGNSDIAFVAYNHTSVNLQQVLPVEYNFFTATKTISQVSLNWQTSSEKEAIRYEVERSNDCVVFNTIGMATAKNATVCNYSYVDASPLKGSSYYRLRLVDAKGATSYSKVVMVDGTIKEMSLGVYPNPATGVIYALHPPATGNETITVFNSVGIAVKKLSPQANASQTKISLQTLATGTYFLSYQKDAILSTTRFIIN